MSTEEPAFTLEKKFPNFEIRQYGETWVAETQVNSPFEKAGNEAFRRLAGYIFGDNVSKAKIAMTAPVTQTATSEKIAMTAPVSQIRTGDGFTVQFTMPAGYTRDTLPTPKDPSVTLRAVPPRRVAVLRYSGSWSESIYRDKVAFLKKELDQEKLIPMGEPTFARFNSPMQLWFLRRNEIWIEVRP
jgi:hypothetical protein